MIQPWRDPFDRVCALVLIGESDTGVAIVCNKNAVFMTLMDCILRIIKPVFRQIRLIHCAYEFLRCLDLGIWRFLYPQIDGQTDKPIALPLAAHARSRSN